KSLHGCFRTPDHHAITQLEAPDAATRAHIDELDSMRRELIPAPERVPIIRVSAVDEGVPLRKVRKQLCDHGIDHIAGRHHHPDMPGCDDVANQSLRRNRAVQAIIDERPGETFVEVKANDVVAGAKKAKGHAAPHLPEADHSYLHGG